MPTSFNIYNLTQTPFQIRSRHSANHNSYYHYCYSYDHNSVTGNRARGGKASPGLTRVLALVDSRGLASISLTTQVSGAFSVTVMRTKPANPAHTQVCFNQKQAEAVTGLRVPEAHFLSTGLSRQTPPSGEPTARKIAGAYD